MEVKIITICGSMRFSEQMKQIVWNLEPDKGYSVIQCVYNEKTERCWHLPIQQYNLYHNW